MSPFPALLTRDNFFQKIFDEPATLSYCSITVTNAVMIFQIDFQAGKPVYLQLADQIRYAAACGRLQPGEALPALRPLSEELRVNRNTIAKAYSELEAQGIVETHPGKGCFVTANRSPFTEPVRKSLLLTEIDEAVVMAHHLQVDKETFLQLVRERLDYFENKLEAAQNGK